MDGITLTKTQIFAGVWHGILTAPGAAEPPALVATHLDAELPGLALTADGPGRWRVTVPVPVAALSEGVQTVLIRDRASGERLAVFAIVTGEPLEDDIRAEVDLLRAELDMLKKAFRRHCLETMG